MPPWEKKMKLCLYAGLSLCALAAVAPAVAEDADLGTIIITANRTATDASKVGSTVVTIGAEEIEARGDEELTDFLATMPDSPVEPGSVTVEDLITTDLLPTAP